MNRAFKAIIIILALYIYAVKTYSQSKEFTVIEPKPYQCIIIGKELKLLWKAPASQDKKNKMSVSILQHYSLQEHGIYSGLLPV